ncbi:hypothetical protein BD413DRAFT_586422 [Trametes elegans]|nr:hypothetical protein BD413DRAFT_586422 [Trametes elegans]
MAVVPRTEAPSAMFPTRMPHVADMDHSGSHAAREMATSFLVTTITPRSALTLGTRVEFSHAQPPPKHSHGNAPRFIAIPFNFTATVVGRRVACDTYVEYVARNNLPHAPICRIIIRVPDSLSDPAFPVDLYARLAIVWCERCDRERTRKARIQARDITFPPPRSLLDLASQVNPYDTRTTALRVETGPPPPRLQTRTVQP